MNVPCRALALLPLVCAMALEGAGQERPPPKIIKKITIQGLKRLSEPNITARMKIRIGQPFDPQAAGEEAAHLFRLGEFTWVEVLPERDFEDGVEVVFKVEEKPPVAAVKFEVRDSQSGKPSLGQKELRDALATRAEGKLSPYSVKTDADKIRQMYNDKGYAFAEVAHSLREVPAGMEVTFVIHEGPRLRIHGIEFIGNRAIDAGRLRRGMETTTKDFLFGIFNPGYYSEEVLSRDIVRVTDYYRGKGFFDARAAVEELNFDPPHEKLRILIRIEEGPRYAFRGYSFEGNRVFSTAVLAPLARAPVNQPYDEERMQEDRREIVKYYRDRAYIEANVKPHYEPGSEGTDMRIRFKIEEGNEVYIEHVRIRKNERTQDRVIRRELEFYPGEKVNYSKFDKSRSNLARLQIFKDIHLGFESGSSPERKNVIVDVLEEESTGQLMLGFGVTSGFGVIGNFSILKRNFDITDLPDSLYDVPDSFTGAGQTLNLVVQPGTRRSHYRATFIEPYIFDTRNSLSLSGSIIRIIRRDYDEDRHSFVPRIGHAFDFDRDLVFSIGSRIEQVEISSIDLDSAPDVFDAEGFTGIIAASSGLSYDKILQDRWEGPYQGHRETVNYEYGGQPLGGEVDFHRIESTLDLYFPIYVHEENQLHHVIGLFSKAGVVEGHHSTDTIPIFERFFLGGPNTVRGFRFRGLGPHFGSDALGGTAAWYGNIEYVFPIFQKFLRGVVFLDYGNLATDLDSFTMEETRLAAGGGVRVNFPFLGGQPLPVGLYLGYAFRREDSDRPRLFLFTIGVPF